MNRGVILALSAYLIWGILPIYWKMLDHVPSIEILSNRIFWSFIFFSIILFFQKSWKDLIGNLRGTNIFIYVIIPAFLITANWLTYIWAVNADFIIETSLGYLICPLVSVLLGVVFLKEKINRFQWLAIIIAVTAVLIMTFAYGQFPWIGMILALSWGSYGLFRKKSPLNAVDGLTLETLLLSLVVVFYFAYLLKNGTSSFFINPSTTSLLIGAGIVTGLPLIIFINGARLIKLSLIGVIQYFYTIITLLIGVFIYHEPLTQSRIVGFILIWIAVIIYISNEFAHNKKVKNEENIYSARI
jgi:chloramphenicol-sensitive protein RarD